MAEDFLPTDGGARRPWRAGWIAGVIAVLLLLAVAAWLLHSRRAASAPVSVAAAPGTRGRISAVTATSLTINSRRSGSHTFTLTPATVVTLDGKPATVQALAPGAGARITSPDGVTATLVALRTRRARGGGSGRGGGPGGFTGRPSAGP